MNIGLRSLTRHLYINEREVTEMIRVATEKDAAELLEIYSYYVEETAITFEYDVPATEEFAERIRNISKKYPYLVWEENGKILGYAYANTFKDRAAYDWSVETTIYVKKDIRHHGIGRKLYEALENALKEQNIINLNACIAYTEIEDEHLTNASVNYHKHLGYSLVGTFHKCGYKFGKWYDMVWMEKMLGEHPDKPLAVVEIKKIGGITVNS